MWDVTGECLVQNLMTALPKWCHYYKCTGAGSAYNKPQFPTKRIGYLTQKSQVLFSLNFSNQINILSNLFDRVDHSTQTRRVLQITLKPMEGFRVSVKHPVKNWVQNWQKYFNIGLISHSFLIISNGFMLPHSNYSCQKSCGNMLTDTKFDEWK